MTTPPDPPGPAAASEAAGRHADASELERTRGQQRALARGSHTVTCSAPLGTGGLGRHFKEIADALAREGQPANCISGADRETASAPSGPLRPSVRERLRLPSEAALLAALPVPVSPGLRTRAFMVDFDSFAARRLPRAEHLIAFNGQAIGQFGEARRAGYETLALVSANSHLRRVLRQHERAHRAYPLEGSWAAHLLRRNLAEYERADRVYVASRYTRESFLEQGYAEEKLATFPFTPDPRYRPATGAHAPASTFDIVYTGNLTVVKGVSLLIDAVARVRHDDIRLRLVGGWGSRGMRRFIERARARDPRILVAAGDPLPVLHRARLYVHASYEDGFGYAPAEALACGVPVLVSQDTGMKDLIDSPRRGLVLATGDLDALVEAIDCAYRGELFSS